MQTIIKVISLSVVLVYMLTLHLHYVLRVFHPWTSYLWILLVNVMDPTCERHGTYLHASTHRFYTPVLHTGSTYLHASTHRCSHCLDSGLTQD